MQVICPLLLLLRKCKNIKMCGLEIERDINAERDIEHDRLEHGVQNPVQDSRQSLDRPN